MILKASFSTVPDKRFKSFASLTGGKKGTDLIFALMS